MRIIAAKPVINRFASAYNRGPGGYFAAGGQYRLQRYLASILRGNGDVRKEIARSHLSNDILNMSGRGEHSIKIVQLDARSLKNRQETVYQKQILHQNYNDDRPKLLPVDYNQLPPARRG